MTRCPDCRMEGNTFQVAAHMVAGHLRTDKEMKAWLDGLLPDQKEELELAMKTQQRKKQAGRG